MPQVSLNTRVSIEVSQALDNASKESGKSKAQITEEALREHPLVKKHLPKK